MQVEGVPVTAVFAYADVNLSDVRTYLSGHEQILESAVDDDWWTKLWRMQSTLSAEHVRPVHRALQAGREGETLVSRGTSITE